MGGERASKARQREAGLICYRCGRWIYTSLPPAPGSILPPAPDTPPRENVPRYGRSQFDERLCPFCECDGCVHILYFLRGAHRMVPGGIGPDGLELPSREVFDGEWLLQLLTPDCTRGFGRLYTLWGRERGAAAIRRLVASGTVRTPRPNCNGVPWDLEADLRHGRGGVTLQLDWPSFTRLTTRGQPFPK